MVGSSPHDQLLAQLRKDCVGPPVIPEEPGGNDAEFQVDKLGLVPCLAGALRTELLRSVLAVGFGSSLALAGWFIYSSTLVASFGICLCAYIIVGLPLPGSIPFLEVKTPAGFHCQETKRNVHIRNVFKAWMAEFSPTPWIRSGEWCTLLPFVWTPNLAKGMSYERIWVRNPDDEEHMACDWAFPPTGYDPARPVVLIYTGLAPDTHWTKAGGFVANSAWYLTNKCNMTAVVVVSRGTMDTQVKEIVFNGARAQDVREVVLHAERAMRAARPDDDKSQLPLFGTGFSMGAIMLAGYCGKFGDDPRLVGVVHFSGAYDGIHNMQFEYSTRTWQTYLAFGVKANIFSGRIARIAKRRGVDVKYMLSKDCASILDIDECMTSKFAGYKDAKAYYSDTFLGLEGRWKKVTIPILAIYARDDPITHADGMHAEEFAAGNENLLFLVTDRGGHVGWPWGTKPWERGFDFMSQGMGVFIEAVLTRE